MEEMIKLLPLDEPGFLQAVTRRVLLDAQEIRVHPGLSSDTFSLDEIQRFKPDLITLAVEPPGRVVERVQQISYHFPCSILLHSESSWSNKGFILKALASGAVDFFSWPTFHDPIKLGHSQEQFLNKIRYWGKKTHSSSWPARKSEAEVDRLSALEERVAEGCDLVVVGVAVGGVGDLYRFLQEVGTLSAPIVVALQGVEGMRDLVGLLHQESGCPIQVGASGEVLQDGSITVVPEGVDGVIKRNDAGRFILCSTFQPDLDSHPSINRLFHSALSQASCPVGVVLSGRGVDGCEAASSFTKKQRPLLVQDPHSSPATEMLYAALQSQAETSVLSLEEMGTFLGRITAAKSF
ncbi:MAG: hypothetical protein HQL72_04095 [Magnetococcales bacterium]|nr:hypothetical protein [Magnetococcales bacterium]